MKQVALIGAAWGLGAPDSACAEGPFALQRAGLTDRLLEAGVSARWQRTIAPGPGESIDTLCAQLRDEVAGCVRADRRWAVVGGDHSCAIGTWSGVARALERPIGLLWVDAHLDAHLPGTSPSGAVHGMPLAVLLGYGSAPLLDVAGPVPVLRPEHVCLIGARDYEAAEAELLRRLGVRVYAMAEIEVRGLDAVFAEALDRVRRRTGNFGVSLDLDAVTPADAPAVSVPAAAGLAGSTLRDTLAGLDEVEGFLGLELVELSPARDDAGRTVELACGLIESSLATGGVRAERRLRQLAGAPSAGPGAVHDGAAQDPRRTRHGRRREP